MKLAQSYIDGLERERTRLAKDLHDGVCNDLLGIGMNMQYMQPTDESKREILALLEQVRSDVRCISHELMPPKFQVTTLAETVEAYVEGLALPASVQLAFSKEMKRFNGAKCPKRCLMKLSHHAGIAVQYPETFRSDGDRCDSYIETEVADSANFK